MKILLSASLILLFSTTAFAQTVVKSCQTELFDLETDEKIPTTIEISEKDGKLSAKMITKGSSETPYEDESREGNYLVRAGLTGDILEMDEVDNLNYGEKLIVHAMSLTEDPIMEGKFSAGMKLANVRSVKVFFIGAEETYGMGMTALVEAKDGKGKNLGTFFGGFLVSPCK